MEPAAKPRSRWTCGISIRSWRFFFQGEDGIRDDLVTGVQTCALPISSRCQISLHCGIYLFVVCGTELFQTHKRNWLCACLLPNLARGRERQGIERQGLTGKAFVADRKSVV